MEAWRVWHVTIYLVSTWTERLNVTNYLNLITIYLGQVSKIQIAF